MRRLLAFVFFVIIALFALNGVFAAEKNTPAALQVDTSKVDVRKFDQAALKKFRADKSFNYGTTESEPSWWTSIWVWIWATLELILQKLFGWFSINPQSKSISIVIKIIEYLFYTAVLGFVVYIILKATGIDIVSLWKRQSKKILIPYNESLENIHEISFDEEIEKALAQHNYRLAVRLLYLKCLKQLSDAQLIQWQIDKTNSAYLYELSNPVQKEIFSVLTRQFEYVWYGDFPIDQQLFANINQSFQNFKSQLL